MMRIIVLTLLLTAASSAGIAAQEATTTPPPRQETDVPEGLLPEPQVIGRAVDLGSRFLGSGSGSHDGFYPDFGGMATGAGWISGGPGYRRHFLDGHLLVDGSAAISWRAYKDAQARVELTDFAKDHLTLGFQVAVAGSDPGELLRHRRELPGVSAERVSAQGYRPCGLRDPQRQRLALLRRTFRVDQSADDLVVCRPLRPGFSRCARGVPGDPGIAEQTSLLHGGAAVEADTRDYPSRPTRGGLYRAAAQVFADRDLHQFSFRRYEAEGLQILPIAGERWLIAVHGWACSPTPRRATACPSTCSQASAAATRSAGITTTDSTIATCSSSTWSRAGRSLCHVDAGGVRRRRQRRREGQRSESRQDRLTAAGFRCTLAHRRSPAWTSPTAARAGRCSSG